MSYYQISLVIPNLFLIQRRDDIYIWIVIQNDESGHNQIIVSQIKFSFLEHTVLFSSKFSSVEINLILD